MTGEPSTNAEGNPPDEISPTGQASPSSQPSPPGEPTGIWIGVDVGSVRVGVARSDPRGVLAVPLETVVRQKRSTADLDRLVELIQEWEAVGVVVGLPRTLAGRDGPAAEAARSYAAALTERVTDIRVVFVDERMTTVIAQRSLSGSGVRSRAQRAVVDQAAAVEILQSYLDRAAR